MVKAHVFISLVCGLMMATSASPQMEVILGNGNSCPDGTTRITSLPACRAAMDLAPIGSRRDDGLAGQETEANWPSGCYYCRNVPGCWNGVWLNHHAEGAANGNAQPLCGRNLVIQNTAVFLLTDCK